MLDSFSGAFDELCVARAIGAQMPDETMELAACWCAAHGKTLQCAVHANDSGAREWPHVDDFSAARNAAWDLATGDFLIWADCDDVLGEAGAEKIRALVRHEIEQPAADVWFFTYVIENTGETVMRERMFRPGVGRWHGAVHETCLHDSKQHKTHAVDSIAWHHRPPEGKAHDRERNQRILMHATRDFDRLAWELHREHYQTWKETASDESRAEAMRWGHVCRYMRTGPDIRFLVTLNQAALASSLPESKNFAWEAIRQMPWRREGYTCLAQLELMAKEPQRALAFTTLLPAMLRPERGSIPIASYAYGRPALELHIQALRACGKTEEADRMEK